MLTQKSIKLKSGAILSAGLPVEFDQDNPSICLVHDGDAIRRVRVSSAFERPTMEDLEEQINDGVCSSVGGNSVEPDGWDFEGTPSWLLVLGMI